MKRLISIIAIGLLCLTNINAQSEDSKSYLPKQGDMAFGINMKPVLKYAGNIFNGNTDNRVDYIGGEPVTENISDFDSDILPDVSIMGKYMLTDNWGLRANIGIMCGLDTDRSYVQDDKSAMLNPFDETKLIDTRKTSSNGMSVMLGSEYRKGNNRIQGVFGMGILLGFYNKTVSYDYANKVTSLNNNPSSAWNDFYDGYRVTKKSSENNLFFGLTGSAGIEWFVAPKVSLGAEVNLSLYYINGGQTYTKSEGYNSVTQSFEECTDLSSPGNNKLRFATENLGGSLYMAFYF